MAKVFSVDLEVSGLYGFAFAAVAVVRENGIEIARFQGRCPDSIISDDWVRENVLPALACMPVTHFSSEELEEALWSFWRANRQDAQCIAHCGSPVESGFFRRAVERDLKSRQWEGPLPLHEVGTALLMKGEDPKSVDAYLEKLGVEVDYEGVPYHPLYDAIAAAQAWELLTQ